MARIGSSRFSTNTRDDWQQDASWGVLLGLLLALATLLLMGNRLNGSTPENDSLDLLFRWRGASAAAAQPSGQVVVLEIDRPTLRRWNGRVFDATDGARLLQLLRENGARASLLAWGGLNDAVLSETDIATLAPSLAAASNAVLPLRITPPGRRAAAELGRPPEEAAITRFAIGRLTAETSPESDGAIPDIAILRAPAEALLNSAAAAGHLSFSTDADGRMRRLPVVLEYGGRVYASLALAGAIQAQHGAEGEPFSLMSSGGRPAALENARSVRVFDTTTPLLPGAQLLLNYPPVVVENGETTAPFRTISVAAALDNPALLREVNGRCVVIGPTAEGVAAQFATPDGGRVPETVLHAIALDNLLTGHAISRAPLAWTVILTLFLCAIVGGFALARPPLWSALVTLLCLAATATLSIGLFESNVWLDAALPWFAASMTFLAGLIARARRQERESTRVGSTIDALGKVGGIIAGQNRPEQVIDRVLQWTEDVMRAEGASVLLFNEARTELHFAAATGPKAVELHPFSVKLGEGIAGWVAEHGEPAIVNDVARDERFNRAIADSIDFPTTAILCVPMRARDTMLGVIEAVNRADGRPFTQDDAELLTAVANQAALFLENARLLEQLNARVVRTESDLAQTNARLQAEKNTLQTVLGSMTDGVIVTDRRGIIHLVNPAATRLLGIPLQTLGQKLEVILPEFAGQSRSNTLSLQKSERQIEAARSPLLNADGFTIGTVWVFADVTEARDIAQAKSDFVSFVAHEMRSPLTSIAGFSSLLQGTVETDRTPSPQVRYLQIIHSESERLKRLINNLLDVARIEAGRGLELARETCDFPSIAREVLDSQSAYANDHELKLDVPDNLPLLFADRDKIAQVLINLVSNALKYSPAGAVTVGARAREGELEAWVSDEGPGIAPEARTQLFERFGAAGAAGVPSTGLGLFLTRYLVEAHGGKIEVDNTAQRGTTFRFTLPIAEH
ncbi:MAG TPA: CHASE2 domain-containing protein [Abditibacteriaceae bacterium]|jgi:signal transduction histidine kinase/CHASE2 domain-containing sensor protein